MANERSYNAYSLFDEFKNFALRGNVIDLAVGVIIGGAFGRIVDSLVKNKKEEATAPAPPTKDQALLMEIRDLLKSQSSQR